ncbi:hypothetical protein PPACK8108_LOCUS24899 [Phakopsora pachyrhizi]|uniref:Uncharacterized protein n=1 Tax=Phakopsora pachyrhizi TaxID=170000 RepID=A0AAV0BSX3_PHAPC|nr:hypothetical protein PPACK8108_LOCUS24899 [Phakopsora pachyrhizi]
MERSYPPLTTSNIFIDCLRPPLDNPTEYQVPSTSVNQDDLNPNLRLVSSSANSNTIQPSHTSQSVNFFPLASCNGFIKASVINDGFTFVLGWLSLVKSGCHPPFQFHFTEKITPSPFITVDELENSLVILLPTNAYLLYPIKFTAPHLFYSEMFEED